MSDSLPSRAALSAALVALAALLGACGLKGDLERPAPLWGEPVAEGEASGAEAEQEDRVIDDDDDNEILDL